MEKLLSQEAENTIKPYYFDLCNLAVKLSLQSIKGTTITCDTPCAEIIFKIK